MSLQAYAKKAMSDLGIRDGRLLLHSLPTVVKEPFQVLWQDFIQTRAVKDLMQMDNGKYLVGMAFLSYLRSHDRKATIRTVDFQHHNIVYTGLYAKPLWQQIRARIDKSTLRKRCRLISHAYTVTGGRNDFIGAQTGTLVKGYMVYKPKPGSKIEDVIAEQQGLLFRSKIPRYLFKRSTISLDRAKTVNNHPWYDLVKRGKMPYSLSVLRTKENFFVIRYEIPIEIPFFFGSVREAAQAQRHGTAMWKQISKL